MADGPQHDVETKTLKESFRLFAIYGDTNASGHEMSGKKFAKLCKDCRVIDTKNITITDVDIAFSKVKQKSARVITFEEFLEALRQLSRKRFKEQKTDDAFQELLHLVAGKAPIVHGITKVKNVGAVGRLTDTSKYTGMHRLRFDEAGHGRGKAGREDIPDQRGYVEGYRDAGTYDQKICPDNCTLTKVHLHCRFDYPAHQGSNFEFVEGMAHDDLFFSKTPWDLNFRLRDTPLNIPPEGSCTW